jgi:polyhydroxybutyrate depolymerase
MAWSMKCARICGAVVLTACASTTTKPTTPAPTTPATPTTTTPTSTSTTQASPERTLERFPSGLSEHILEVDSFTRRFLVDAPEGTSKPSAVVVVLHGGGGSGLAVAEELTQPLSVFRNVADREGFVVVYPEGLPANDVRGSESWVDCRADNRVASDADDIAFLTALITLLGTAFALPSKRIFMAGTSNGALMTQAFAFHHPESIGAIAISSGNLPEIPRPGPCTTGPLRPVPVLLMHGTADAQMPFDGGCVANVGSGCNRGRVISAEGTRDRWLAINGASGVEPQASIIDRDFFDAGVAHLFVFGGAAPVHWWRLEGAGHTSPSRLVAIEPTRFAGAQNRDIEFAEIAWDFFDNLSTVES